MPRPSPTVMLVESVQDDRAMYAEYLRASAFGVIEVGDTAKALTRAAEADVIVTGIRVPGPFNGIELVHRLRSDHTTKERPVIVLTASAIQTDRDEAGRAGCDAFLLKPCLPDALVGEIRRLLTIRHLPGSPRRAARAHHGKSSQEKRTG
jgi:two-component system, cell cycle response regulator DivK